MTLIGDIQLPTSTADHCQSPTSTADLCQPPTSTADHCQPPTSTAGYRNKRRKSCRNRAQTKGRDPQQQCFLEGCTGKTIGTIEDNAGKGTDTER